MHIKRGYFYIYLAAFIWGTLGVFARKSGMPPVELSFYRLLFAGLVLSFFLPREPRLATGSLRTYLLVCGAGFLFAIDCVLFFHALQLTTLSNTVFPYNLQPVFMIVLARFLFGEKSYQGSIRFICLSLLGLSLLFIPSLLSLSTVDILGISYAMAGAFCLALVALIAKKITISAIIFVYYEIIVAALCLVLFMRNPVSFPVHSYLWAGSIGLIHTVFAYVIYYQGLRTVKLQHAAAIVCLAPVVAAIMGYIFFQERLSLFTMVGGILITLNGIIAVSIGES